MQKNIIVFSLFISAVFAISLNASAATAFTKNLSYGTVGSADVTILQQFLTDQGIYSGPVTGNFYNLTKTAVQDFQTLNAVTPVSGYFGPLTRGKANAILAAEGEAAAANVAINSGTSQGEVAGVSSTNMLAYMQFQLNKISWNLRNMQQRYFRSTPTPAPVVTTPTTPTTTAPIVATTTKPIVATTTPKVATTTTPAPTPKPAPTSTPVVAPVVTTTTTQVQKPNRLMWGAYTGNSASALAPFVSLLGGKSPDIQAIFLSMGLDDFPTEYKATVGLTGKTLLIFWEPNNGTDDINQPNFSYSSILSGKYDANMKKFAAAAKAYGYPIILVPMDEMNSNWEPWGGTVNGNTPAQFAQVWAHVHDLFTDVPNVKFGWAPNAQSVPNTSANAISAYWPGAQYVDYVGVDGFNGNGDPWQSFSQIFTTSLMNQLAAYGKPVFIFSLGSTVHSSDATAKANWIKQGLGPNGMIANFPGLVGWIWFNQNGGTSASNWLINSDTNSLNAFKEAIPQ